MEGNIKIILESKELDSWILLGINGMCEKLKHDYNFADASFNKLEATDGFSLDSSGKDWVHTKFTLDFEFIK
jgi:hypothetical protein